MDAASTALASDVDLILDTALYELRRQRDQLAKEAEDLRRQLAQLRGAVLWAVKEFQHGDAMMAEQRLLDALEVPSDEDNCGGT